MVWCKWELSAVTKHVHPEVPPHAAKVCHLGCIEDRLLENRVKTIKKYGGGFGVAMAGAGAALLTKRDGESCLGQLTDAYLVDKYDKFVIRVHLHCGKVALLTAPGGELEGQYDADDVGSLYAMADAGVAKVSEALKRLYGEDIPGEAEVVDIIVNDAGEPDGVVMPRPKVAV
jgi:hypothetical protein